MAVGVAERTAVAVGRIVAVQCTAVALGQRTAAVEPDTVVEGGIAGAHIAVVADGTVVEDTAAGAGRIVAADQHIEGQVDLRNLDGGNKMERVARGECCMWETRRPWVVFPTLTTFYFRFSSESPPFTTFHFCFPFYPLSIFFFSPFFCAVAKMWGR